MKRYRIALIAILSILLLILIANFGLNYWISKKLPGIINDKNDSAYQIVYRDLDVSLFSRSISATDIVLIPKNAIDSKVTLPGLYAKVSSVKIHGFHIFNLIFTDKIKAKSIRITTPEVILYQPQESPTEESETIRQKVKPLHKLILVSQMEMINGDLKIVEISSKKNILHVANISVKVDGIAVTDDILQEKIPVIFNNYDVRFDSLYYKPNAVYELRSGSLKTVNSALQLDNLTYLPVMSRTQFVKSLASEKDLFSVKAKQLKIDSLDWGYREEDFFIDIKQLTITEPNANIYRAKSPPDDLTKKPLYSQLLRELPFFLKVDKLNLKYGTVEYEEQKTSEAGAGLLSFNGFNAKIVNISSGFKQTKLPDVHINVDCKFMNTSNMNVKWSFNVLDKTESFKIQGSILKFPADKLTPFIKPYMNVTAEGMLDKIYFNYSGNDHMAKGDFALEYEDLEVNVLQKDRKKKNKFISAVANIFVKKDTNERVKETAVEVERIQEKSFFNLLWRTTADGLKKLLI